MESAQIIGPGGPAPAIRGRRNNMHFGIPVKFRIYMLKRRKKNKPAGNAFADRYRVSIAHSAWSSYRSPTATEITRTIRLSPLLQTGIFTHRPLRLTGLPLKLIGSRGVRRKTGALTGVILNLLFNIHAHILAPPAKQSPGYRPRSAVTDRHSVERSNR